jgi:hypothetical protein
MLLQHASSLEEIVHVFHAKMHAYLHASRTHIQAHTRTKCAKKSMEKLATEHFNATASSDAKHTRAFDTGEDQSPAKLLVGMSSIQH